MIFARVQGKTWGPCSQFHVLPCCSSERRGILAATSEQKSSANPSAQRLVSQSGNGQEGAIMGGHQPADASREMDTCCRALLRHAEIHGVHGFAATASFCW